MPRDERFIEEFCEHVKLAVPAAQAFRALLDGDAQGAAAREGFLADRMELVAKPFSFDTLARRIRKLVDQG